MDEPRRPGGGNAAGVQRPGLHRKLAGGGPRQRRRRLWPAIPPGSAAYAARPRHSGKFPVRRLRLRKILDARQCGSRLHCPHPRTGGRRAGHLRPVGRRGFGGDRRAAAPRHRQPAQLHLRQQRPAAAGRGRAGAGHFRPGNGAESDVCGRLRAVRPPAGRGDRPGGQAQGHRRRVHPRLRRCRLGVGADRIPGARHPLPRCHRKRNAGQQRLIAHQNASQCGRAAAEYESATGGAAALSVQGRSARNGAGVGAAPGYGAAAAVPRPRPGHPHHRRSHPGTAGYAAGLRLDCDGRNQGRRAV